MAITFHLPAKTNSLPWKGIIATLTLIGCGYMGWQLWMNGIDRAISEDSIRSQQLRLSTGALQQVQNLLEAYHQPRANPEALSTDPLVPRKNPSEPAS